MLPTRIVLEAGRTDSPHSAAKVTHMDDIRQPSPDTSPTEFILASAPWPAAVRVPNPLEGEPSTRTLSFIDDKHTQAGTWQCTPGAFRSDHSGYVEFMHILDGKARLIGDDGATVDLEAGMVLVIPDGWTGTWNVTETLTKSFAISRSQHRSSLSHPPADGPAM